jgi:hypothetical protein
MTGLCQHAIALGRRMHGSSPPVRTILSDRAHIESKSKWVPTQSRAIEERNNGKGKEGPRKWRPSHLCWSQMDIPNTTFFRLMVGKSRANTACKAE